MTDHMLPYKALHMFVNDLVLPINICVKLIIVTRHILSALTLIIVRLLVAMYLLSSFVLTYQLFFNPFFIDETV